MDSDRWNAAADALRASEKPLCSVHHFCGGDLDAARNAEAVGNAAAGQAVEPARSVDRRAPRTGGERSGPGERRRRSREEPVAEPVRDEQESYSGKKDITNLMTPPDEALAAIADGHLSLDPRPAERSVMADRGYRPASLEHDFAHGR